MGRGEHPGPGDEAEVLVCVEVHAARALVDALRGVRLVSTGGPMGPWIFDAVVLHVSITTRRRANTRCPSPIRGAVRLHLARASSPPLQPLLLTTRHVCHRRLATAIDSDVSRGHRPLFVPRDGVPVPPHPPTHTHRHTHTFRPLLALVLARFIVVVLHLFRLCRHTAFLPQLRATTGAPASTARTGTPGRSSPVRTPTCSRPYEAGTCSTTTRNGASQKSAPNAFNETVAFDNGTVIERQRPRLLLFFLLFPPGKWSSPLTACPVFWSGVMDTLPTGVCPSDRNATSSPPTWTLVQPIGPLTHDRATVRIPLLFLGPQWTIFEVTSSSKKTIFWTGSRVKHFGPLWPFFRSVLKRPELE